MHGRMRGALALALLAWTTSARADDNPWRPAAIPAPTVRLSSAEIGSRVSLGRPQPLARAQAADPPPPPAFPGVPGGGLAPPPPTDPAFGCGVVTSNGDQGSFWSRCGNKFKRCWDDVTGGVNSVLQPAQGRTAFQSDHSFDQFISPVSNPLYFEDPRALTEFRPVFMWQHTPGRNPVFGGGDNFFLDLQGRVAFTPWLSLVVNQLGWTWTEIDNRASGYASHTGFQEIHLGPKFTFLRNETTGTVMAGGLTFAIPSGPAKVFQDTGNASLIPYYSVAQSWRSGIGTFNFMNTDGYSFGLDNQRTDFFYASFHVDYEIAKVLYPLVELNWTHYTTNGGARPFNFEGSNVFNFGSTNIRGNDDLTLALGTRYKVNEALQFGLAGEFNVLGNTTGRHLDKFRLTFDMIFRY